jgi:muconate cycloisomerase
MRIAELSAFHVRIPLRRPIRHASHTRTETDNLVIRCRLDDGTLGFGEGVPRDYVTGETIDSALAMLQQSAIAEQLLNIDSFPSAISAIEQLQLPTPDDDRQIQGNVVRCAVELALLDAFGKRLKQPLSEVTKLLTPALYAPREWVRYSGAITSARGWKLRISAWSQWIYGLQQIKVKVGIDGYDDVSRLKSIRKRVGKAMDLRIDANEAWSPAQAVSKIRELEPFGITSIEQPVAHEELKSLSEIRKQIQTPIMLDESLCGMIDAQRAIEAKACDLFNLRLSKCGGFIRSLRLAEVAKAAGLGCQLGCQVGETAILSAAGRHFACSVGGLRYLEGSYDSRLVREALGTQDITFGWGGKAPALSAGGGLGIEIDPKALQRVTIRTIQLA